MTREFTLRCKCGRQTWHPLTNEEAFAAGWKCGRDGFSLCPECAAKRERKSMRDLEKRFGKETAARATAQVDALLGRCQRPAPRARKP